MPPKRKQMCDKVKEEGKLQKTEDTSILHLKGENVKEEGKVQKTEDNSILRLKALLYVALNCIYLQSGDDIRVTIGQAHCHYGKYRHVLTEDEMHGECVLGYMSQGYAKKKPVQGTMDAGTFLERDHEAACVHTNWLFSHMFVLRGKFNEAVNLAERAAETMFRVSGMTTKAALALAEKLDITNAVLEADKAAEAALVHENTLHVSIPRLPSELQRVAPKYLVAHDDKDEARIMFEDVVTDVFSCGVCIANEEWDDIDEVMLCATGLRKRYDEMTAEERVSSGAVVLGNILKDLKQEDRLPEAIAASLVAARALAWNARRLESACEKVRVAGVV